MKTQVTFRHDNCLKQAIIPDDLAIAAMLNRNAIYLDNSETLTSTLLSSELATFNIAEDFINSFNSEYVTPDISSVDLYNSEDFESLTGYNRKDSIAILFQAYYEKYKEEIDLFIPNITKVLIEVPINEEYQHVLDTGVVIIETVE